jgi:hypothetical protein
MRDLERIVGHIRRRYRPAGEDGDGFGVVRFHFASRTEAQAAYFAAAQRGHDAVLLEERELVVYASERDMEE